MSAPRPVPAAPSPELLATLQLVADTIVESLGFEVAVVNLVVDEVSTLVAAVAGPDEVREVLLSQLQGQAGWDQLIDESEAWGRLRFLDHRTAVSDPADMLAWIPDLPVSDDPDAWHPQDALFSELTAPDGRRLGMLSVDVPRDGKRPRPATLRALEALSATASLALQHAWLAADSRRSARRFEGVFDSSPVAIGLLDATDALLAVNDAFCRFLQRERATLLGHRLDAFRHPDDAGALAVLPPAGRPDVPASEERYLLPDGSSVWGRRHVAGLSSPDEPGVTIVQVEDVTDRKRAEALLVQQAHYDVLTGLPNRAESVRRLQQALQEARVAGTLATVFFCDLDRLKQVNDAHGHRVGDAYIRELAARVRRSVREDDVVGRLSGDEFVVVLRAVSDLDEALALAARVLDAVHRPLRLEGAVFTPTLSLGVAAAPGGDTTADELLAQADVAMYLAKTEGRGLVRVYDQARRPPSSDRLDLRSALPRALRDGEFRLHFQPIVELPGRTVVGHEALLRWQHPQRGLLLPAQFLDVLLDSEYETPVTDWVLGEACRVAAASSGTRVTVNVSSTQVGRPDLPEVVARCLHEAGLAPARLVLELTEDRLLSRADAPALLDRLRGTGASLALDDFGSGYAGLGYLQRFRAVDVVKLDRSFAAGLCDDDVSRHIVAAMCGLAARLGVDLVVEGVETEEQSAALVALGAGRAQGWLYGRAAPLEVPPRSALTAAG